MQSKNLKEHILAFMTIFIWALTFLCTKALMGVFSNLEILFLRYAIAYVSIWAIYPKKPKFLGIKYELALIAASFAGTSYYQYMENLSVKYTTPASVSFITAMAPLFTAVFSAIFLKSKLTKFTIIGMIVSIIGVGFVTFGDSKILDTGLKGDLIIFCNIWLWAIYTIIIKVLADKGIKGFEVTRKLFFYSLVEMAIPLIITADLSREKFTVSTIAGILYLGIFASAVCFYTWNRAAERLGPVTTAKYLFIMPAITLIAQVVVKMSKLSIPALFGMALILVGLYVSERKQEEPKLEEVNNN
ncbi:MAG: DMT family transporter [Clostridia bacterium]|nr:DMT family transporter [Clostridia bacterium]